MSEDKEQARRQEIAAAILAAAKKKLKATEGTQYFGETEAAYETAKGILGGGEWKDITEAISSLDGLASLSLKDVDECLNNKLAFSDISAIVMGFDKGIAGWPPRSAVVFLISSERAGELQKALSSLVLEELSLPHGQEAEKKIMSPDLPADNGQILAQLIALYNGINDPPGELTTWLKKDFLSRVKAEDRNQDIRLTADYVARTPMSRNSVLLKRIIYGVAETDLTPDQVSAALMNIGCEPLSDREKQAFVELDRNDGNIELKGWEALAGVENTTDQASTCSSCHAAPTVPRDPKGSER